MKNFFITALGLFWGVQCAEAAEEKIIRISTDNTDLVLQVAENGRLYQTYLGEKLLHESDLKKLDWQIHPASESLHADGKSAQVQVTRISLNRL